MQVTESTNHHILLVEDEPELLDLIAETLRDFGFDVTALPVGTDALRLFSERPNGFDLVISDQNMPGMPGAELMSAIRRIREDIPLMLMTGDCEQSFGNLSDTKVRVLGKPFDDQELVTEIRALLHLRQHAVFLTLTLPFSHPTKPLIPSRLKLFPGNCRFPWAESQENKRETVQHLLADDRTERTS